VTPAKPIRVSGMVYSDISEYAKPFCCWFSETIAGKSSYIFIDVLMWKQF